MIKVIKYSGKLGKSMLAILIVFGMVTITSCSQGPPDEVVKQVASEHWNSWKVESVEIIARGKETPSPLSDSGKAWPIKVKILMRGESGKIIQQNSEYHFYKDPYGKWKGR